MRLRQGVAAICVIGIAIANLEAQTVESVCRPKVNPNEAVCSKGQMHEDKTLHYTVYLHPSATGPHQAAFRDAMKVWNDQSATTEITLEETLDPYADLRFQLGEEQSKDLHNRACAAYDPLGSLIWYSEPLMRGALKRKELAVRIYTHEIGHALNLAHLSEPKRGEKRTKKLMQHAERDDLPCETVALKVIADVQPEDAKSARFCAYGARAHPDCVQERAVKSNRH